MKTEWVLGVSNTGPAFCVQREGSVHSSVSQLHLLATHLFIQEMFSLFLLLYILAYDRHSSIRMQCQNLVSSLKEFNLILDFISCV